jgi:hypothetical protein
MMLSRRRAVAAVGTLGALAIVGGAAALLGTASCASIPDSSRYTVVLQPDYEVYKASVDNYLQRRCGTLDCHGQPGRAYRIYGFQGFRLYNEDAGLVSGLQPTTEAERRANFQAIVALEPEEMSRVIATQGEDPNKLIFLRKPLQVERHKGGPAMAEDDPGYRCVVSWLRVPVIRFVDGPEGRVPQPIPPGERGTLTARQQQDCQEAESFP